MAAPGPLRSLPAAQTQRGPGAHARHARAGPPSAQRRHGRARPQAWGTLGDTVETLWGHLGTLRIQLGDTRGLGHAGSAGVHGLPVSHTAPRG